MWDMNNWFIAICPDLCHPALGGLVVMHHQETPNHFPVVEIEVKVYSLLWIATNMHKN